MSYIKVLIDTSFNKDVYCNLRRVIIINECPHSMHSEREVILLDALNFSNHFRAIRPRYRPPGNSNTEQPGEIPASGLSSLFLLVSVKSKSWRAPPPSSPPGFSTGGTAD
jgi:hypothetical protein